MNPRPDRRQARRSEAAVRQAGFDAEVRDYAREHQLDDRQARAIVNALVSSERGYGDPA